MKTHPKNDERRLSGDYGVLPSTWIQRAHIGREVERLCQPASLDLCAGQFYSMPYSILPGDEPLERFIDRFGSEAPLTQDGKRTLLPLGQVYLARCTQSLDLPENVFAVANPKSSVGRADVHVRLLTAKGHSYDRVPKGYKGPIYLEVVARSFPVLLDRHSPLAQLRFVMNHLVEVSAEELAEMHDREPIVRYTPVDSALDAGIRTDHDDLILSANTRGAKSEIVGFKARKGAPFLDLAAVGTVDPSKFWTPLRASDALTLEPGDFYLLRSRELVSIPKNICAEMVPFDAEAGEFRAHYAGFFDNGFGANNPSAAVLEVRNHHQVPMRLAHGQPFCRLRFLRFATPPTMAYGSEIGSHYQGQRLSLSKHFAPWPTSG